jgi:hypothetical protein
VSIEPVEIKRTQYLRVCLQPGCGNTLATWNNSGYCTKHHREGDRLEPRFCKECRTRLRSDTPDDLCADHRLALAKPPQSCTECGKKLNSHNESGYCNQHYWLGRPSHDRAIAKAMTRKACAERGCKRAANKNGFCRVHRYAPSRPSVKPQFCKKVGCGTRLRSDNEHGYCKKHDYLWPEAPQRQTCQEPGCTALLGFNNTSGYCGSHRQKHYIAEPENKAAARKRTAAFRARERAHLADLKRIVDAAKQPPDPRITLAACLERQGLEGYGLANPLFFDVVRPKSGEQREARQDRRKKLYKRHTAELERERHRISSLSENELRILAEEARSRIRQQD